MQWPVFFSTPLKQEIARQLSRALNREVTVGNVKGGLLYQTTLSDIKIAKEKKLKDGTLATIDSATITYHPLKFILNRANILPAISRIEVSGLHANVIREKDGQLNVARLLSAADPAHPPGYFPFRAKVTVKNGTIDFADLAGIFPRPLTPPFKCQFTDLAANLDFRTKGRLTFSSSGIILQNGAANPVACLGEVNLKNTKSKFTIQAQNLELKTWFDYVIPQIGIQAETGRADVNLVLSTQPDNPTHPVAAEGEAQISQAQLLLPGHRINNINGAVAFTSDQVTLKKVRVAYEKIPALVSGRIFNFENPQLDLTITSPSNFNWSTLPASFNFLRASKLSGTGSYIISATGPVPHPVLSGKFEVLAGKIFGYACYGNALLSGNENALLFNVNTLNLCGGALSGPVYYSLNQKNPEIKSTVALRGLNLAELANETPGVSGRIYGKAEISGTLDNLNGEIAANLFEAELLGQPIDAVAATFNSRGGETTLHKFELSSKQASLESHGTVAKDLKFSLFADCRNVKLKGEGPLGPMAADLQKFTGAFSGQFNDELLAHPLLNLNCSGEVFLKNGAIGQQSIGLAQSQFKLEDGRLTVDEFSATSGKTTVRANGCVGGKDTSLLITAKNASFSDLTILNQFLPDKFDHPTGRADLTISVSGNLPQNLKFDSWLFLGDLNYDVDCTLHNAKFYHTFFQNFMLNFSWRDHLLSTLDADFKTRTSTLRARLSRAPAQIQLDAHGYLDLDEFQFLLFRFGKLGGQVNFNLAATEAPNNPLFKIKVAANNFIYNSIQLDKFNGEFQLDQNTLSTIQPVAAKIKGNQYTIDGQINFRTAAGGQWLPDSSDLTIHLSNADLGGIYAITQNILAETSRFIISPTILGKTIHSRSMLNFSTPDPQKFQRGDEVIFYLLNDKGALIYGFLKNFALYNRLTAKDESQNHRQFDFASNLSGKTNGDVEVTGPFTKIKVETDNLVVENGRFFEFNFDRLDFQGRYYDREISLDNCKIQKDYGNFNVAGKININTADLNLSLSASRFPTDALRLIFPGDKTFGGKLNLAATIAGKLQNPKISAEASAPNLNIQGINFQDMTVDLDLIDKVLFINNLSFSSQGKDSQISGYFPLSQNGKINLAATLEGEALGLINLLTNEIQWIEGRAKAQVAISGTRSNLDVDGEISLEKARIYVNALQSSLKEVTGQLVIHNSKGDLSNLAAVWEGVRTKDVRNQLSLSGTLNVKDLLAEEANVAVDLTLADTALTADLPDLISGTITLQDINLHGPFYFSGTQSRKIGPTLSGKAKIEDGTLYLPKGETKDKKILFLDYDLTLSLGKNTYAVGGDVSNVINPLLVNLQIQGDNLVLKGNSMKPSLLGEINFLQGTINLFDRELSLLPPSQQEKYFVAQREKINDNKAVFNDGNGETAILPELNLTAKVVVENYTENADATYTKEKITILTQLTGQPYVKDEAKGIKTTFYSFREEPGGTNIQAASFTQDEIRVMLLPDFLKSALGLSRASSNVEATALAAEYLQGRFQSYLSATISRQIERSLELENMTLEYNLGRDLRRISGASSTNNDTEEKLWALGFTKGFFDKFFIDWHYSAALDNSTQAQKTYFNYELSYKISGIWSIAYFQEPNNVMDPLSGQSKTTLRAKLRF
ncbi:MAG: translocation/assembly module TamB domain-containing protein [Candidatus Margulisiibacteriota bacterium]